MDSTLANEVSITDLFEQFIEASTMRNVLSIHHRIMNYSDLSPCEFNVFFPKLKRAVMTNRARKNWKAKALFSKIDKKAAHRCYSNTKTTTPLGTRPSDNHNNSKECLDDSISSQSNRIYHSNNALQHYNCLVIGSGPAGLRTAIELQLLGASRVVVVEKRGRFSRNNVLHLWPFVIDDLKSLGAKKFYGKFCAGSIDHISIRQLQLILLKICLMIGCDFRDSCSYLYLCPSSIKHTNQATNGNNRDSKEANGSSDSAEPIATKCDLVSEEPYSASDFVKVPDASICETNISEALESETAKSDQVESDEAKSSSISKNGEENSDDRKQSQESGENCRPDLKRTLSPISNVDKNCCKRSENLRGARAHFQSEFQLQERELHSIEWDVIIGADGRRNTLSSFFPRKEFRGRLAIAITANFINRQTPAEASISEISGLSFIYNQDMFNALAYDTNIQLENICYYKDDTHYFVMTAKKKSLLERGVLIKDHATTQDLLSDENVDKQALLRYAKDAAHWTTGLEPLDFALNHYGQEDCAMFDFTSMYAASNACKALRTTEGGLTLVSLVGDSLLEPFWPTGSGCARGFLSSFDAAWMCRQWAVNKCAVIDHHNAVSSRSSRNRSSTICETNEGNAKVVEATTYNRMALSVMAERESIYRILAQTTSENLQQNYSHWTLNPHSRYPNLNRHLVIPSQVEHLITDNDTKVCSNTGSKNKLSTTTDRTRRIKSPINGLKSRRSPKKLKSADASPLTQPKYGKGRSNSNSKHGLRSKSKQDITLDDTYLEFEQSYKNLADSERDPVHYLNHRRPDCDIYDDYFIPSISGTLPSSNNLLSLEARRARDIDECLRQRRQRTQLSVVRDHIIEQFKREGSIQADVSGAPIIPGGAAVFNRLRRLKEQQSKDNRVRDINGPLTLLNSIRRCASFAERVKSFESKLGPSGNESTVSTPKTPIDDVKNLPQFATLQELFVTNSALNRANGSSKKSKIPIMKLSKDDWNVKCWEKRLAASKQKSGKEFSGGGSTKSLNKAASVDSYHTFNVKSERQVEIFKDRIKEMAEKLKKTRDLNQKLDSDSNGRFDGENSKLKSNVGRPQGWVSHVRQELIKGVESRWPQNVSKPAMNPADPSKPIKKLFDNDDDGDDGIDINKHYDHLCINRPTNKYLPKKNYTSHLMRTKYDSTTSKVINVKPSAASKQAYIANLSSRGSSSPSTLSDYSSANTGESPSMVGLQLRSETVKCFRCTETIELGDKITIGDTSLHRICLTCANCRITLRTNEIQHYLDLLKNSTKEEDDHSSKFICAICQPNIRAVLSQEAATRLAQVESESKGEPSRIRSREEFLNERINYNELYKNILNEKSDAKTKIDLLGSESRENTPTVCMTHSDRKSSSYEDAKSNQESLSEASKAACIVSPSPVNVTLPLKLVTGSQSFDSVCESKAKNYRIARSETIDGSEQVTLTLPSSNNDSTERLNGRASGSQTSPKTMIDEDELQRILYLDNSTSNSKSSPKLSNKVRSDGESGGSSSNRETENSDEQSDTSDENREEDGHRFGEISDEPSSLNSPPDTEDYDDDGDEDEDDDDHADQNSTYDDFLTSEEFGASSDREDGAAFEDAPSSEEPGLQRVIA